MEDVLPTDKAKPFGDLVFFVCSNGGSANVPLLLSMTTQPISGSWTWDTRALEV